MKKKDFMSKFTEENIKLIETWKGYLDNGHYGNAKSIVDTYNEVFEGERQKQPYTSCGGCLRRCVMTMWNALEEHKKAQVVEEPKQEEPIVVEEPKPKKRTAKQS